VIHKHKNYKKCYLEEDTFTDSKKNIFHLQRKETTLAKKYSLLARLDFQEKNLK